MNKEEFIGKLQMVYVGDKRASEEIISEYDRLNNIINKLVLSCYGSAMSLSEFENIWEIAFNKKYYPEEIDKLKELKENNK